MSAQGCEKRATLGKPSHKFPSTLKGLNNVPCCGDKVVKGQFIDSKEQPNLRSVEITAKWCKVVQRSG